MNSTTSPNNSTDNVTTSTTQSAAAAVEEALAIGRLRMEIYIFITCATIFWLICMGLLYRHHKRLTKKRRKEDISLVIDEEDGDAQYVISFFTGLYSRPPTGKVKLHLIGSLFPGKFHTLFDPSHPSTLFPPLSREKFVVTEDVSLGRIIAIVIQTECEGESPTWHCQTVIARDVRTNEAWYFKVDDEVSFPPLTILAATEEDLTSFKRSFQRRVRREVRQGQYIYFGFWFRTTRSVYRLSQRIVTAIICHFFLLSLSLVFLGLAFPPETDNVGTHSDEPFSYQVRSIKFTPGNNDGKTNWVLHALTIASMVSFLTSCVGYLVVALFRQRTKYENQLEEMDYVIGTALHEHNLKKAKQLIVNQSGLILPGSGTTFSKYPFPLDYLLPEPEKETEKEKVLEDFVATLEIEDIQEIPVLEIFPAEPGTDPQMNENENPDAVTADTEANTTLTSWEAKFYELFGTKVEAPPTPQTIQPPHPTESMSSWRKALAIPAKIITKFNPFATRNSEKDKEKDKERKISHAIERRGTKSFSVKTPPSSRSSKSSIIRPGGTQDMLDQIEELNLRLGSGTRRTPSQSTSGIQTPLVIFPSESEKKVNFPYHLLGNTPYEKRWYMRQLFYFDVTFNPMQGPGTSKSRKGSEARSSDAETTWFGTPEVGRKCYRPLVAWLFAFTMICASVAGIVLTILFGSVQLHGEHEFFYLIMSATIIISLFMGAFVIETIKICLIGAVFAVLDRGMYKRITRRGSMKK